MAQTSIFSDVLARIEAGETLSDRKVVSLYVGIARLIRKRVVEGDASEISAEEADVDLLFRRLDALCRADSGVRDRQNAFDAGIVLAAVEVYEYCVRLGREEEADAEREGFIDRFFRVFQLIEENPSITQRELAKELQESPSSVSQKMRVIRGEGGLVSMLPQGQRKHYRLTPLGKRLYEKVASERAELVDLTNEVMSPFTNGTQRTAVPVAREHASLGVSIPRTNDDTVHGQAFMARDDRGEEPAWLRGRQSRQKTMLNSYSDLWSRSSVPVRC